jgi:hypothetical protein
MIKPKIMILGTFHMSNNKDLFNSNVEDLASDKRQNEILELVNKVKKFNPTKIAVEYEYKNNKKLNENYNNYINNEVQLKINETHQIAFRLAKSLEHKKIYSIDWMEKGASTCSIGEIYEHAKSNEPEFLNLFNVEHSKFNKDITVSEIYRLINEKEVVRKTHESYVNMARIGLDKEYLGMGWLTWWYQRNLILFAHLAQLIEYSSERIFLLIGSGHIGILTNFLEESGSFEVVPVIDYL